MPRGRLKAFLQPSDNGRKARNVGLLRRGSLEFFQIMQLLSWGANGRGQLGVGSKNEECPRPCSVELKNVQSADIRQVTGGATHSLVCLTNGDVLGCGWNSSGQLGDTVERGLGTTQFVKLSFLEGHRMTQVSTKWEASFGVDSQSRCIAWGANNYGELGRSKNQVTIVGDHVIQVACGLRHALILTESGDVLSAGEGKRGQLGRPPGQGFLPVLLTGVKQIACGQYHNLALTSDKIFSWGCNKFGQLSIDPELRISSSEPIEVKLPNVGAIKKIACGWTHSAALTEQGVLINWGRNTYGQLGRDTQGHAFNPEAIDLIFKDVSFGSEHNLGITSDDSLVTWGWNEHGSCGLGHLNDVKVPTRLSTGRVGLIGSGSGQSFAVTH